MEVNVSGYEIVRELGRGASATVWHAIHRGWKPCALKVFSGDATNPETAALFREEVHTAMSFSHGSVVQVFDAGITDDGRMWMACEWVDGVALSAFNRYFWERGGKWPFQYAAHVIGRLLVALTYIHEFTIAGKPMHVVHRDIKPQNLLVSAGGEVKLTDFGVAKMWRDDSQAIFRGTVRYACRDHLLDRATQKADLFGAGAVLHELLANESFRATAQSSNECYKAILDGDDLPDLPDVPGPLQALRRALLAPFDDRVDSAREAHALLMRWPHYRPGELGLSNLFREVMGRTGSSGVTLHDGSRLVPKIPLPLRYRNRETLELSPFEPEPDAPEILRRRPTEIVPGPTALAPAAIAAEIPVAVPEPVDEDDSSQIRVTLFFKAAREPRAPAAVEDAQTCNLGPRRNRL